MYNDNWPQQFANEQRLLVRHLGDILLGIHHIGSTAIKGMVAKPIIDILLEVGSHQALDAHTHVMERMGYVSKGEFGVDGRRYFQKGRDVRSHQIHAYEVGDENIVRHLVFRDFLRTNPATALAYGKLKQELVESCGGDVHQYYKGKKGFIKEVECRAIL